MRHDAAKLLKLAVNTINKNIEVLIIKVSFRPEVFVQAAFCHHQLL
jgi:hypothetical protein